MDLPPHTPLGAATVLVHGLWLHGVVLRPLGGRLARRGFAARAFSYPSLRRGLAENADALARFVAAGETPTVHLVGHSLGGLVVLGMLARHPDLRVGRVVLMGAPCAGSHCAEVLLRTRGLAAIIGRTLTDWLHQPRPLLPPGVEIGVIAGNHSVGLGRLIPGLPRPNDGVVAVAETRLATAADSIVLPVSHSQMLLSGACADQVAAFLGTGRFAHGG